MFTIIDDLYFHIHGGNTLIISKRYGDNEHRFYFQYKDNSITEILDLNNKVKVTSFYYFTNKSPEFDKKIKEWIYSIYKNEK
jgi:hypothetical protein